MTQGLMGVAGGAAGAGAAGGQGRPPSATTGSPGASGGPGTPGGASAPRTGGAPEAPQGQQPTAQPTPAAGQPTRPAGEPSPAPGQPAAPAAGRRPAAAPARPRGLEAALAGWRTELASLGGPEPLMTAEDLRDGSLELASAHPSGVALLLAGRPTRLSHLFREAGALEEARRRARTIRGEASALADEHGLQACVLAVGLASWHDEASGTTVSTPLLLRPAELHARGSGPVDYEIGLGGPVRTNPALVRELQRRGVPVDPAGLAALSVHAHGFDPAPALERLRSLTRVSAPDIQVKPGLLVTVLVDVARSLVAELDRAADDLAGSDVALALSGDTAARTRLQRPTTAVELPEGARGVDPDDVQVLPLDASQRRVLDTVLAGRSVRVEAGPGTGATQVAATAVAALAATGRSVLLVAGQQQEAEDVARRLAARGLGDLLVDATGSVDPNSTGPLPVIPVEGTSPLGAGGTGGQGGPGGEADVVAALGRHRAALHTRRGPWGVSALEAMAALAVLPPGPDPVRLAPAALRAMDAAEREKAAAELREAVDLGALSARVGDTAWSGAALANRDEAAEALDEARALRDDLLPALRRQATVLAGGSGLRVPGCVSDAQAQLDLLARVRDCLDSFLPAVFDRPLTPLIDATAPPSQRTSGPRYGVFERRRLERAARELVRPGVVLDDLHGALLEAERSRLDWEAWRAEDAAGAPPRVPQGVPAAEVVLDQVVAQVSALSAVLAPTTGGGALADEPWHALTERLGALVADSGTLADLPQRAQLLAVLERRGLVPLLEEARRRGLDPDQAVVELRRSWWRSVLDTLVASDPALGALDAVGHAEASAALAAREKHRRAAAVHRVRGATALSASAPCRVSGPLALSVELATQRRYDVVLVLAAHRVGVPEALLAASAGRQLVVVGDPGGPTPVRVAPRRADEAPLPRGTRRSVFDALEQVLPTVRLAWQHRMPLQLAALAAAVPGTTTGENAVPCPPGRQPVRLRRVSDVTGRPDADGVVNSPDGEVAAVVDLVLSHVRDHPNESLAVVALTRPHARRIADAIRSALPARPELAAFLRRRRRESFVVTDVERCADTVRDAVVFSVGLGVTPLGRFVHRFGPLDDADGHRWLASVLTRARKRLTVVSCVAGEVLEASQCTSTGASSLRQLLLSLEEPPAADPLEPLRAHGQRRAPLTEPPAPDPLLARLSDRLAGRGARALVTGTVPDVVVLPAGADGPAVAVLTDIPAGTDDDPVGDLVQRELVVPEQLGHLGWGVVRVSARELFDDPTGPVAAVLRELSSGA
ncbi:DUF4011 domain-containing protein [Quadrisphaera setariae]|uniref:Part of AAA domain-containing protein n=1 Tax=Quadrisphaera setariae TaxID=2593304 RepID=A0A5C8ZEK0_9ACTN|nr:DUF4011 domain-containing protein [Quadrisphaera setariae]TXR56262.1 hypothetical protein FMM08_09025 [Quadrisphaera setariae]